MIYIPQQKAKTLSIALSLCLVCSMTGCGGTQDLSTQSESSGKQIDVSNETAITAESAQDSKIDFSTLKEENSDLFAWLYVPGTQIDCPVLQSEQADDFYINHNASGAEDSQGAVYIELANLTNMCDFNTVLHGNSSQDAPFTDLYQFADPDFFDKHETIYLYLEGNVLTYEVFAAYERDNTSLIRDYDFTYSSGCQEFLDDLYTTRDIGKNIRDGWDFVNPYHFLITLTTQKDEQADSQFVVVALLTQDVAGTISRTVEE